MDLRELFEKMKGYFQKGNVSTGSGKKIGSMNLLVIIGCFGVLLMILANSFETAQPEVKILSGDQAESSENNARSADPSGADIVSTENLIEKRLAGILGEIHGVGEVKVTVNLASTMEYEYAINTSTNNKTTEEKDQKGGNRTVSEINEDGELVLIREGEGNKELPVIKKEIKPQVQGVVVVAEGAENPELKAQLTEAVQVYLNLSPHRVVVLPKESR